MNAQTTSNTMLDQFRKQGVTRKSPSFFGKALNQSPAESMLAAFKKAGVVRNEPSFFGQPLGQLPPQLHQDVMKPVESAGVRLLPVKRWLPSAIAAAA